MVEAPKLTLTGLVGTGGRTTAWLDGLRIGQVLHGRVVDVQPGGRVSLQIGAAQVTATVNSPLTPGATLAVEVLAVTPAPVFRLLEEARKPGAGRAADAPAVRALLARQGSLPETLSRLATVAQAPEQDLPTTLQQELRRFLQQLPPLVELADARRLKKAFEDSGLFLEARLAIGVTGVGERQRLAGTNPAGAGTGQPVAGADRVGAGPDPDLSGDLKAGLSRLLGACLLEPRQGGALAPSTDPVVRPAGNAALSVELAALIEALEQDLGGALARIGLHQVQAVSDREEGRVHWVCEIPFVLDQAVRAMPFEISADAAGAGPNPARPRGWGVRFSLASEALGRVDARVFLRGNAISLALRSERPETAELLRQDLDWVRSLVTGHGLEVQALVCAADTEAAGHAAPGDVAPGAAVRNPYADRETVERWMGEQI